MKFKVLAFVRSSIIDVLDIHIPKLLHYTPLLCQSFHFFYLVRKSFLTGTVFACISLHRLCFCLFIYAPYVLDCDAYDLGIGGVLSQRIQGEEKVISKESRLFRWRKSSCGESVGYLSILI